MFIPKPPKLFHRTSISETPTEAAEGSVKPVENAPSAPMPESIPEAAQPAMPSFMRAEAATDTPEMTEAPYAPDFSEPESSEDHLVESAVFNPADALAAEQREAAESVAALAEQEAPVPMEPVAPEAPMPPVMPTSAETAVTAEVSPAIVPEAAPETPVADSQPTDTQDMSRFARPTEEGASEALPEPEKNLAEDDGIHFIPHAIENLSSPKELETMFTHFVQVPSVSSIPFADLWFSPEGIAYVRDTKTKFALVPFEADDLEDFRKALDQGYTGSSSYSLRFAGEQYRVERIMTTTGVQYNCRKMPTYTPDVYELGLPKPTIDYLVGLAHEAGLVLFGGPTGMGKTTTASALMKKWLENEGGFLYTIEDPPEMPLDGLYRSKNGGLGLCKQTAVENERWGDGLKSALRSRPRYILVGEIRTPETASQALRAATSGHLVVSTIHASSVEDALNSMIKYAAGTGLPESLVSDLLARGILAVVHQKLEGVEVLTPKIQAAFANPKPGTADQMRMVIRDGKINLSTLMEAQEVKLFQGKPLFKEI